VGQATPQSARVQATVAVRQGPNSGLRVQYWAPFPSSRHRPGPHRNFLVHYYSDPKYGRLAGLEDVTPHTLRHSFGKHALDAGANLVSVAALLGHERMETTAIYTPPSQRDPERVVEKLEQDSNMR